ncbi:MAG: PQQ-binding-like beta-propeller repeat protein [Treponema sp.]
MMYKKEYKILLFTVIFSLFPLLCHSGPSVTTVEKSVSDSSAPVKIDSLDRSWFAVLTGSPSGSPFQTDYGFLEVQEDRFLACYLKNGQLLWNTNIQSKIKFLTVTESGFIYVITEKNQLFLLNPSGLVLWKNDLPFVPQSKPLVCFDGRVFIQGKNNLACYGIGGSLKWNLATENQNSLQMQNLNDGSVLLFLEKLSAGKTCALRVSPFGAVLEEIVFQGIVAESFGTDYGTVLVFKNGGIGMCAVNENAGTETQDKSQDSSSDFLPVFSKWADSTLRFTENVSVKKIDERLWFLFSSGKAAVVNVQTGICRKTFDVSEIDGKNILVMESVDDKIILADSRNCVIYNLSGNKIRQLVLPEKNGKYKWNYVFFINTGFLTFLSEDWIINSFKITSTSRTNEKPFSKDSSSKKKSGKNYFITARDFRPSSSAFSNEIYMMMKNGNYGQKERKIANDIFTVLDFYIQDKRSSEINKDTFNLLKTEYSVVDMENVIRIIPLFESGIFQQEYARLLSAETDKTLVIKILDGIRQCAYDPDGELLLQIELLVKRTNPREKAVLQKASEAVCEICRFMGKPAFISQGKKILSNLFYPQYDESTKKTVRTCLQKLADLDM